MGSNVSVTVWYLLIFDTKDLILSIIRKQLLYIKYSTFSYLSLYEIIFFFTIIEFNIKTINGTI